MIADPDERGDRRNTFVRALLAGALVAAGHVAAFGWLTSHNLSTQPPDSVLGTPIELDLLAVAPPEPAPAPPQPTPEPTPTQEPAAPPPSPEPTPPPTPEPTPPPEVPPPPEPAPPPSMPEVQPTPVPPPPPPEETPPPPASEPTPELPTPTPTPTTSPPAAAVVAPSPRPPKPAAKPIPKPQPPKPRPAPPPKPDPENAHRDEAQAEAKQRARELRRQQRSDAAHQASSRDDSRSTDAPRPPASGSDVSTWRGEVMARISEFKPASSGASGTAVVAFSVDSGGRVVSASIVRSSGDASLDAASVSMVRRASPVPAPPAGLGGRINLTVPVRFQ